MINDSNNTNQSLAQADTDQSLSNNDVNISNETHREDLASRLERARLSMEGPERTLRRERSETEDKVETERKKLEDKLGLLNKDKEKYEINWVVLDNKQSELKKLLDPIKAEEDKIELEEERLESQEHTTSDVLERQNIEKKRWAIQDQRKEIEKQKWSLEDKILVTVKELEKNTIEYQKLLDEEEGTRRKIDNLEYELDVVEQQIKLQQESQLNRESEREIEGERIRRQTVVNKNTEDEIKEKVNKVQTIEIKKSPEESQVKSTIASTVGTNENQKKEDIVEAENKTPIIGLEAEQQERAALEIKRQAAMEKLKLEETPIIKPKKEMVMDEKPQSMIDSVTTQKNSILELARQKARDYESQAVNSLAKPSPNIIDLTQIIKPEVDFIKSTNEAILNPLSPDLKDVSNIDKNPSGSMPKLRTFKTHIESSAEITDQEKAEARKRFPWLK